MALTYNWITRDNIALGTSAQTLMTDIMNQLNAVSGWDIHDNQITGSTPYFVMKVTTSEAGGNDLYVWFQMSSGAFRTSVWPGWNATTHVGTGTGIVGSETYWDTTGSSATTNMSYRISCTTDHAVIVIFQTALGSLTTFAPTYVGLFDKLHPESDTQVMSALALGSAYWTNPLNLFSNDNTAPVLRPAHGGWAARGNVVRNALLRRARQTDNFIQFGPWNGDGTIYACQFGWYEAGVGLRGLLHGLKCVMDAPNATWVSLDIVTITGIEYMVWKQTYHNDDATALRNSYGNYVNVNDHRRFTYLIRMTP